MERRLYGVYFLDDEGPVFRSLGEALIVVTEKDAAEEVTRSTQWSEDFEDFEHETRVAEKPWIAAAMRKAHRLGMQPGGQVTVVRLRLDVPHPFPVDTFMTPDEAKHFMALDLTKRLH